MNDDQVERLIDELAKTRESFAKVVETVKWTKRNTIFQYALIVVVLIIISSNILYYQNQQTAACNRGNDLRVSIEQSLDANAFAIGVALTNVTNAPQSKFDQYMKVYNQQAKPQVLELRDC